MKRFNIDAKTFSLEKALAEVEKLGKTVEIYRKEGQRFVLMPMDYYSELCDDLIDFENQVLSDLED